MMLLSRRIFLLAATLLVQLNIFAETLACPPDEQVSADSLCAVSQAETRDEEKHNVVETVEDNLYFDSITGRKIHLQRFGGVDTLRVVKPNPWLSLFDDLAIDGAILAFDYFYYHREYSRITKKVIRRNINDGWVWDNDSFSGNQFSHPYQGAMHYNAAREHGMSYYWSLLYPFIGSATWETFCETNRPAINDLLTTGVGGSVIGEVFNRASDIFYDDSRRGVSRVLRELIGGFLNPVRGAHRLFSGEMFRVSSVRGKKVAPQPYSFSLGLGDRIMTEDANRVKHTFDIPFLEIEFLYGDRFNSRHKSKPFEYFTVNALINFDDGHPTVGDLDIVGRLASHQTESKRGWHYDWAFYQSFKYVDSYDKHTQQTRNFPILSEAVSFGAGLYAEKRMRRSMVSNNLILSAVALGGTNGDHIDDSGDEYFSTRRYNFGSGFSVREQFEYHPCRKVSLGDNLYAMQLFTFSNQTPAQMMKKIDEDIEISTMGDAGGTSAFYNKAYANVSLKRGLNLQFTHILFLRHSNYRYLPSITGISRQYKIGVYYSL